ncbi:MAG TPA: class I SAM-dependent methyltransferase [Microlunatus sp.]|nr:class I SAM-dependent methyltransferase [Microlunatus sp.]
MRTTTRALARHYIDQLDLHGDVLEIGGHRLAKCAIDLFPEPRFRYHDLNLMSSDIPNTIIADITGCADVIADESFDIVISSDVFEHIDRPWLAASEIARILKPGGLAITHTLFSWRNHPCPIDYWRYSPECLEFLFADLTCLEKGYDLSQRRVDEPGFWASGEDSVPIDHLGGWREHWSVYCVSGKGTTAAVPRFKDSDHPLAGHLRRDTQGVVTNPKITGTTLPLPPDPTVKLEPVLAEISSGLQTLEVQTRTLSTQVENQKAELARLRRTIGRPSLPERAYRKVQRALAGNGR